MLQSIPSQCFIQASARRSADAVTVRIAPAMADLQLNAYYGYWFSHCAPDTHPAPTPRGRQPENSLPPVGYPTGGFVFLAPQKTPHRIESRNTT